MLGRLRRIWPTRSQCAIVPYFALLRVYRALLRVTRGHRKLLRVTGRTRGSEDALYWAEEAYRALLRYATCTTSTHFSIRALWPNEKQTLARGEAMRALSHLTLGIPYYSHAREVVVWAVWGSGFTPDRK